MINPNRLDEEPRPWPARRRGRRLPAGRRGQPGAAPAPAGMRQRAAEPDLQAVARSGGARHHLRRGAADRPQPRPGDPGPEGDGGSAAISGSRRWPTWRGSTRLQAPITPGSSWGRGSMPAGGWARRRSARGCSRPTDSVEAAEIARRLDAYNAERKQIEEGVLAAAIEAVESAMAPGLVYAARRRLASRRDRHRRQPVEGTLRAPGLCRRRRRRYRQGFRPVGPGRRSRRGGDRRPPGGASHQWRRPCHGGRVYRAGRACGGPPGLSGRAARRRVERRSAATDPRSRCRPPAGCAPRRS